MKVLHRFSLFASTLLLLTACSSTQYIMSTKEGRLIVSDGKPELNDKADTYTYKDSEGRKTTIPKADIVQVMER